MSLLVDICPQPWRGFYCMCQCAKENIAPTAMAFYFRDFAANRTIQTAKCYPCVKTNRSKANIHKYTRFCCAMWPPAFLNLCNILRVDGWSLASWLLGYRLETRRYPWGIQRLVSAYQSPAQSPPWEVPNMRGRIFWSEVSILGRYSWQSFTRSLLVIHEKF